MAVGSRSRHRPRGSRSSLPLTTDAETSARLGRIRQRDTSAELAVQKLVRSLGHHFRTSNRDLPGSPDLANRSRRWAIFVHGCFWHRHRGCPRTTTPKRNREFWRSKFAANLARDRRVTSLLVASGYTVLIVWECETRAHERLIERLRHCLHGAQPTHSRAAKRHRRLNASRRGSNILDLV